MAPYSPYSALVLTTVCSGPGPNSRHSHEEKTDPGVLWVFVVKWVTHLYHPFYWPMCNHWKINWMSSVWDYPTNGTLKTLISYVSPSCGWTTTRIIYSWLGFPCIGRTEQLRPVKREVVLCIYLSITAVAQCLILRKSRYCSPEVEYLMISCRPHYLPREFSSNFL